MSDAKTLLQILSIEDEDRFMSELVSYSDWEPAWSLPELKSRPGEMQLIILLNAVNLCIGSGGIGKFLTEPDTGSLFGECRRFCGLIGARLMLEYLNKAAAYFPGGRVPEDDNERWAICEDLEWRDDCRNFGKENAEYGDIATREMVKCLRRYIGENLQQYERAMRKPK